MSEGGMGLIGGVARLGAAVTAAVVGPLTAYLVLLVVGAFVETRRRQAPPPAPPRPPTFAVLVPAHNESRTIDGLLASLRAQRGAVPPFTVHVVADNCTDDTAARARAGGATVHERYDLVQRGKGYALAWLIERVRQAGPPPDAWLVLDADSTVAPDLLACLAARLAAGAAVVQARYEVNASGGGWASALRAAAFSLVHHTRPLGKRWYGGSAGLKGNGMAFANAVLQAVPWRAASLTEDVEHHLRLLEHGYRVTYAPEARVWTEMPSTLADSATQNERWEGGRLLMVRQRIPAVVVEGLRRGDLALLDAALEQLVPPFATLMAVTLAGLGLAGLGRSPRLARLLGLCWLGQALYTVGGLWLGEVPRAVWLALLRAPVYILWKLWLWLRMLIRQPGEWVRTQRT